MVTHSSTSRPVQCLCMAERTGCPVLTDLWSYVSVNQCSDIIMEHSLARSPPHVYDNGTQELQRGVFRRRRFRDPLRDQPNHHDLDLDLDIAAAVVPSIVTGDPP